MEFQGNGGYRVFGPIKGTWKSEGLVDPEQLGRWRSRGQKEPKRKVKEEMQIEGKHQNPGGSGVRKRSRGYTRAQSLRDRE